MMKDAMLQKIARHLLAHSKGKGQPVGKPPTAEELTLLLEDKVDRARREEVYSWLNHSPQLFSEWIALIEALEAAGAPDTAPETVDSGTILVKRKATLPGPKDFINWIKELFEPVQPIVMAASVVTIAFAVVYLSHIQSPAEKEKGVNLLSKSPVNKERKEQRWLADSASNQTLNEWRMEAFNNGYQSPNDWGLADIGQSLTGNENYSAYVKFGKAVAKVRQHCAAEEKISNQLIEKINQLTLSDNRDQSREWTREMLRFKAAVNRSYQRVCSEAVRLERKYTK